MFILVSVAEVGVILVVVLIVLSVIGFVLGTKVLEGYNEAMGYSEDTDEEDS